MKYIYRFLAAYCNPVVFSAFQSEAHITNMRQLGNGKRHKINTFRIMEFVFSAHHSNTIFFSLAAEVRITNPHQLGRRVNYME